MDSKDALLPYRSLPFLKRHTISLKKKKRQGLDIPHEIFHTFHCDIVLALQKLG